MKAQHTPEPWHVFNWQGKATIVQNTAGQAIADCDVNHYIDQQDKEANARLIAAAPELLGALKMALVQIVQDNDGRGVDHEHRLTETQIRAAIAKAQGGAQ